MRHLLCAFLITGGLAACGGKQAATTPAAPPSDDPVTEMNRLKDAMCACESNDCVNDVGAQLNDASVRFGGRKLTDAEGDAVAAATDEINRCIARVQGAPEDERHSAPNM